MYIYICKYHISINISCLYPAWFFLVTLLRRHPGPPDRSACARNRRKSCVRESSSPCEGRAMPKSLGLERSLKPIKKKHKTHTMRLPICSSICWTLLKHTYSLLDYVFAGEGMWNYHPANCGSGFVANHPAAVAFCSGQSRVWFWLRLMVSSRRSPSLVSWSLGL